MALRKEEDIRAELEEIQAEIDRLDVEIFRLRRMKKGILEAYGLEDTKKRSWTRRKKEEQPEGDSNAS